MNSKEIGRDRLKNNDERCFKWAVIAALHHGEIEHHPERISVLQH